MKIPRFQTVINKPLLKLSVSIHQTNRPLKESNQFYTLSYGINNQVKIFTAHCFVTNSSIKNDKAL